MTDCDFIVVGAGSAGCVIARQLADQYGSRVVLVEAPSGLAPAAHQQRPSHWLRLLESEEDWNYRCQPQPELAGRVVNWPRGRGPGGSGRINAMIWFPPTDQDFVALSRSSGSQWSAEQLRNRFQQIEHWVRPESPRWLSVTAKSYLQSVAGWGDHQPMVYQRANRSGRRWTPSEWLADLDASCLRVHRAIADRICFDGDRAVGLIVKNGNGSETIRCRRGVAICAGTIATPLLLMRSGIGPCDQLARHGIDLRVEAPSVGQGLRDHLVMPVIFRLRQASDGLGSTATPRELVQWQTLGGGPITSNLAECGGLFGGGKFQLHVTPTHYLSYPQTNSVPAFSLAINLTQPESVGQLEMTSKRPADPPRIDPCYLSAEMDQQAMVEGVKLCREIAARSPLSHLHRGELIPGERRASDEAIRKSIARFAQTLYHPVGTCAFGNHKCSVVNPSFQVRQTQGLWIADGSILPHLTQGNPNATIMMLAKLAADSLVDQSEMI